MPTLGQVLRQAREQSGLSLRHAAERIYHPDGRCINYRHLHAIEKDRRRPPLALLQAIAHAYRTDVAVLLARAQDAETVVRVYVCAHPTGAAALARLILWAHHEHFRAWERVLHGLSRTREQPPPPEQPSPQRWRA